MLLGCTSYVDDEAHYIPKGYIGRVRIDFNDKNGMQKQWNGTRRIYQISDSGKLRTRFSPKFGINKDNSSVRFYYNDEKNGDLSEVMRIDLFGKKERAKLDSNMVVVAQFGYVKEGENFDHTYSTFYVDTLKNFTTSRPF